MPAVELYSYEACPFAQRSRMVLMEKRVDFELTEIDVYNKPDNWLEISPYGKVPVLRHNGGIIYESMIINEYLDEVFPNPPLMPADSLGRARARIWMDFCDRQFLSANHKLRTGKDDPKQHAENKLKVEENLQFIEHEGLRKLSDGPYWLGQEVSLVDLHYSPFFERFGVYDELYGVTIPENCTRIHAWLAAMQERDSYQSTAHSVEYHTEQLRIMLDRIRQRQQQTGT